MKVDASKPDWPDRDRFILSKGHSSIGLYVTLHLKGFISAEDLATFRQDSSTLWGHIDQKTSGIEVSTGSLGHGLSIGLGRALAAKIDEKSYTTYVLMGDGETQEGSVWEAAMAASNYGLDNIVAIVDRNRIQQCGHTEDIMALEPFVQKWKAFGWKVLEIDGHNFGEILDALAMANASSAPCVIVSNTVKGKGVSFMEDNNAWHGGGAIKQYADRARSELVQYADLEK